MSELHPAFLVALGYLLGSTPTSYWVGKLGYGVDLRRQGSGNLGATNTLRVLGIKAALPVIAVDVAKGWLPVWLAATSSAPDRFTWTLAVAAAAIVGHVFSFWVGFRGGKGVATSTGAFLALAPLATLITFGAWVVTAAGTRIVSLASLVAALVLPVTVALTHPPGGEALLGFTVLLTAFVFWTHRANLGRLFRGEEHRLGAPGAGLPDPPASSDPSI